MLHLDYDGNRVWGVFCGNDVDDEYSHGHFIDNYATEAEAAEAWNTRAERTCVNDGTIKWDWDKCEPYWQHELSCGHVVTTTEPEPPKYCEECGAKVVSV